MPEFTKKAAAAITRHDLNAVKVPNVDRSDYTDDPHIGVDLDCALRKLIICGMDPTDAVQVLGELATDSKKPQPLEDFGVEDVTGTLQVPLLIYHTATAHQCADASRYLSDLGLRLLGVVAFDLGAQKGTISEDENDAAAAIHAAQALLSLAHNIAEAGLRAPVAKEGA